MEIGQCLFSIDHDECGETGMCAHGICINMDGSFKCQCQEGYALSPSGHACIGKLSTTENLTAGYRYVTIGYLDLDECAENPRICLNGRCENIPGSFECVCEEGFSSSAVGPFCVDMDECGQTGMCDNGKCINMDGSFKCVCDSGYKLSSDGKTCIGKNK